MLFREIIEIYFENNAEHINSLRFDTVWVTLSCSKCQYWALKSSDIVLDLFLWMKPKIIFNISRTPCYDNKHKAETKLAAHGDYCIIVNCRKKKKTFRDVSRDMWNFSWYFRVFISLFHSIAEPWFGNAGLRRESF